MSHPTPDELTLAALGGDDDPAVREHLRHCPTCAAEVEALRRPVEHLRGIGVDPEPPASVWAGIRAELGDELPDHSASTPLTPLPAPRRRRTWLVPALAAAAAVLAVVVGISVARTGGEQIPVGAPVVMRSEPGVRASMAPVLDRPGEWQVRVETAFPLPAGEVLQVWREDAGRFTSAGWLERRDDGSYGAVVPLGPPGASEVDVSVEDRGGDAGHSGRSVAHSP
jgi:hypothetical protein